MTLYNLRSHNGVFRITKFTADLEVESSYLLTQEGCECPQWQGRKAACRHMKMLPRLRERIDTAWFWDYNRQVWVDPTGRGEDPVTSVYQQIDDEVNASEHEFRPFIEPIFLNPSQWAAIEATGQDMSQYKLLQPILEVEPRIRRRV